YSILSMVTLVPMILTFTLLHHLSGSFERSQVDRARDIVHRSVAYYMYATLPLLALVAIFYRQLVAVLAPTGYDVGVLLPATLMAYFFAFGLEQVLVFSTFSTRGTTALRARLIAFGINVVG